MGRDGPIRVAVIGGGCASITTAFELTQPVHQGKYQVTVYQQGWRLGGKGASGRGPAGRIEEHGLHVWLGFYENAFRLLRECYAELDRDPATCPMASWRDAFFADSHVGIAQSSGDGQWLNWSAFFPPADGLPGDPLAGANPFSIKSYLIHASALLRTLLVGLRTRRDVPGAAMGDGARASDADAQAQAQAQVPPAAEVESFVSQVGAWMRFGALTAAAGLIEAAALVEVVVRALPRYPQNLALQWLNAIAGIVRTQLEGMLCADEDTRCKWEIIDLVL
ncbi:MAG TPA: NAD(P)-binding protein, partial [Variovorax sp.]